MSVGTIQTLLNNSPNHSPSRVKGSPKRRGGLVGRTRVMMSSLEIIHLFFLNPTGWHSIWYPLRESVRGAIKSFQSRIAAAPPSRRMNRHGNRVTTDRANQLTPQHWGTPPLGKGNYRILASGKCRRKDVLVAGWNVISLVSVEVARPWSTRYPDTSARGALGNELRTESLYVEAGWPVLYQCSVTTDRTLSRRLLFLACQC